MVVVLWTLYLYMIYSGVSSLFHYVISCTFNFDGLLLLLKARVDSLRYGLVSLYKSIIQLMFYCITHWLNILRRVLPFSGLRILPMWTPPKMPPSSLVDINCVVWYFSGDALSFNIYIYLSALKLLVNVFVQKDIC